MELLEVEILVEVVVAEIAAEPLDDRRRDRERHRPRLAVVEALDAQPRDADRLVVVLVLARIGIVVDPAAVGIVEWAEQLDADGVALLAVDGLVTGDVGDATLGERLILSSGFVAVTVVVRRGTGKAAAPAHLYAKGFSEDPKALEPVARKVEVELENLASQNVTDPTRIAQEVRRTVGKWVGETYRRQPMIVPTVDSVWPVAAE